MTVRYEVAFDCRDSAIADRLTSQLIEAARREGVTGVAAEDGAPMRAITIDFPDGERASGFFRGDGYRQFCADVRTTCRASVLLVPLGPIQE